MDKVEAREILAVQMATFRELSYEQLVERLLDGVASRAAYVLGLPPWPQWLG
jgi:hypothetical protein